MTVISYMLTIWDIILWIFRSLVTIFYTCGKSFVVQPLNAGWEIALIFASIPCIILVIKRNVIGAACFVAIYGSYFGTAIYNTMNNIVSEEGFNVGNSFDLAVSIICIVIPVLTFIDILLNKNRKSIVGNSKTDWFYKNSEFDRKHDERDDTNQYKIK